MEKWTSAKDRRWTSPSPRREQLADAKQKQRPARDARTQGQTTARQPPQKQVLPDWSCPLDGLSGSWDDLEGHTAMPWPGLTIMNATDSMDTRSYLRKLDCEIEPPSFHENATLCEERWAIAKLWEEQLNSGVQEEGARIMVEPFPHHPSAVQNRGSPADTKIAKLMGTAAVKEVRLHSYWGKEECKVQFKPRPAWQTTPVTKGGSCTVRIGAGHAWVSRCDGLISCPGSWMHHKGLESEPTRYHTFFCYRKAEGEAVADRERPMHFLVRAQEQGNAIWYRCDPAQQVREMVQSLRVTAELVADSITLKLAKSQADVARAQGTVATVFGGRSQPVPLVIAGVRAVARLSSDERKNLQRHESTERRRSRTPSEPPQKKPRRGRPERAKPRREKRGREKPRLTKHRKRRRRSPSPSSDCSESASSPSQRKGRRAGPPQEKPRPAKHSKRNPSGKSLPPARADHSSPEGDCGGREPLLQRTSIGKEGPTRLSGKGLPARGGHCHANCSSDTTEYDGGDCHTGCSSDTTEYEGGDEDALSDVCDNPYVDPAEDDLEAWKRRHWYDNTTRALALGHDVTQKLPHFQLARSILKELPGDVEHSAKQSALDSLTKMFKDLASEEQQVSADPHVLIPSVAALGKVEVQG